MSELTDELANSFTSAEQQSETPTNNVIEEQTQSQEPAVIDEWMDAPKAYTKEFQDTFKELSPKWREYLTGREKQIEKGFSDFGNKINNYKWSDDLYNSRQERLSGQGVNDAQTYLTYLTTIDDAMAKDPRATLLELAKAYNVNFNNSNDAYSSLQNQFLNMQNDVRQFKDYILQKNRAEGNAQYEKFVNAKDENGNLVNPYVNDVRSDMYTLIKNGVCNTLEDAYQKAIWMNDSVRTKLIEDRQKADLNNKVAQANKAKEASFTPKSKATAPEVEMDIREQLAKEFDKEGI